MSESDSWYVAKTQDDGVIARLQKENESLRAEVVFWKNEHVNRCNEVERLNKECNQMLAVQREMHGQLSSGWIGNKKDVDLLVAKLDIAKEALGFYAERANWVSRSGRIGTSVIDIMDREQLHAKEFPWAGGVKAREALAEIGGRE